MGGFQLLRCTCVHAFQDERYGPQVRVFNLCKDGWRCTVCGAVKASAESRSTRR